MYDSKFYSNYLDELGRRLSAGGLDMSKEDLDNYVRTHFPEAKDTEIILTNNTRSEEEGRYLATTASKLVDIVKFNKYRPIITGHNTLFHTSQKVENVPGGFLKYLGDERKVAKKVMFEFINSDPEKSALYNLIQLCFKLLGNSYYGAFGQRSFHFFNPDLGPSVTAQGRQIIISAIMGFENFLTDNIALPNFDDLCNYIINICNEHVDEEFVLECDVTHEMVIERLKGKCTFAFSEIQESYLENFVEGIESPSQLQKLYFKNNLFGFLNIPSIKEFFAENLVHDNFSDVNSPPEDLIETLDDINDWLNYFVYYTYQVQDKYEKVNKLKRRTVLLTDTDSTFLDVGPYLRWICEAAGLDRSKLTKLQRCSLVSPCTFFITKFIIGVFAKFTESCNVEEHMRPIITMKSELVMAHYKPL